MNSFFWRIGSISVCLGMYNLVESEFPVKYRLNFSPLLNICTFQGIGLCILSARRKNIRKMRYANLMVYLGLGGPITYIGWLYAGFI